MNVVDGVALAEEFGLSIDELLDLLEKLGFHEMSSNPNGNIVYHENPSRIRIKIKIQETSEEEEEENDPDDEYEAEEDE